MAQTTLLNDRIEFSDRMHIGLRVFLFIAGLLPWMAPYELLIKPHWKEFNLFSLFFFFISLGAISVSCVFICGALFGLNQTLSFDADTRTVHYAYESFIMKFREKRYAFCDVSSIEIYTHEWDSRPDSYGLEITFCDKLKVQVVDSNDKREADRYRETLLNWIQLDSRGCL